MTKNTTPTNEAGHGLPGVAAAREVIRAYFAGELDDTMILNLSESLALSRGVPADMVLVPKYPTKKITLAMHDAYNTGRSMVEAYDAMLAAAPAAAGAQGEDDLDVEALHAAVKSWEGGQSAVESMAQVSATINNRGNNPNLPFPQPAAADGGVRERAREILGLHASTNVAWVTTLQALEAVATALSSHRQAGDEQRAPVGNEALFLESDVHEMLQDAYRLALPPVGDQARAPNQIAAADWIMKHEGYRAARTVLALNMAGVKPKCVWPNCVCDSPSTDGCGQDSVWVTSEECTLVEKGGGNG